MFVKNTRVTLCSSVSNITQKCDYYLFREYCSEHSTVVRTAVYTAVFQSALPTPQRLAFVTNLRLEDHNFVKSVLAKEYQSKLVYSNLVLD